jgi:hypothetical protein
MKIFLRVVALAALFFVVSFGAFAQTTVTTSAPSDTTINVGQLLAPWLQGLVAAAVSVIMALFGWLTIVINTRANVQNNAAVLQMEAHMRDLLETALTNSAGWVVMKAGPELDKMSFDVKSPLIVQAVMTINNLAGSAVAQFGLSPEDLAKKIIAKIGVLTASNSAVTPTTTASAPAA